jgi:hypothetical protein
VTATIRVGTFGAHAANAAHAAPLSSSIEGGPDGHAHQDAVIVEHVADGQDDRQRAEVHRDAPTLGASEQLQTRSTVEDFQSRQIELHEPMLAGRWSTP